jgi:hypothetical protein
MTDLPSVKSILMDRDNMSEGEAEELIIDFKSEMKTLLEEGPSLDELETLLEDYFGLEPDYLMEFLPL